MGILLTMIVRNEAAVIRRCLEAARPNIDAWSIVDTGSTDQTRELIQEILRDVPGRLHTRPWVNFGHNRTESFELARSTALELGHDLGRTYALLLDADHELQGSLNRDALTAEGYYIRQHDTGLSYSNIRLIRADLPWRSVGVTHEYWGGGTVRETLEGVRILDHADGGTRAEKFPRDVALLQEGLKAEPKNVRYMFYLAQTYEGMGDLNNALKWYAQRMEAGGFEEERWMARLRYAKILAQTAQINQAKAEFLKAWDERPHRAEPLYHLSVLLKDLGQHHAAYLYAKTASEIPLPEQDILFVEHPVYRHLAKEGVSISGYYFGKHAEAAQACEDILATRSANHATALLNQSFYVKPIEATERGTYDVPEALRTFDGVVYNTANPSVCDSLTVVRAVNYVQERGKHYAGRPDPQVIKTQNFILKDGRAEPLISSILSKFRGSPNIQGLEDIRVTEHQGELWFTATTAEVTGRPQVVLGKIEHVEDGMVLDTMPPHVCRSWRVTHLVPLKYAGSRDVEKNWLLWSDGRHGLKAIYSFDPFVVLSLNTETGEATEITRTETRWWPGRFRGSANPIPLDWDTWIAVVHDVAYGHDRNVYTHRFVSFTRQGELAYSKPFFLEHNGIEYCAGLNYNAGQYTLSYGFEDREAKWLKVDAMMVREMIGAVPRLRRAA